MYTCEHVPVLRLIQYRFIRTCKIGLLVRGYSVPGIKPSTVQFRLKYYIGPNPNCMYLRGVFVLFSTTYAWTSTWIIVQCNCTPECSQALFPYTNHPCTWWKYDQIRPIQLPACLLTSVSCPLKRGRPRLRKTAARVARLRITKPCNYNLIYGLKFTSY